MVTVTHAEMGEGPCSAWRPAMRRSGRRCAPRLDERMGARLCADAEKLAKDAAARHGLGCALDYHEIFVASLNATGSRRPSARRAGCGRHCP